MLAIGFVFGGLLWGASAAAAPVLIHLIMRTKPRRMPFPALQFVRKTHKANISRLKLKHIILLLMRMAALALIAMLLARAFLPAWFQVPDRTIPAAAVFVVDNSGSMTYRTQGRTLLSRGKEMARTVLETHLPTGSRFAVVPTAESAMSPAFLSDPNTASEQINGLEESYKSGATLAALGRAVSLLEGIDMARKEIYFVTDMTESSWRELAGLTIPPGVRVTVLNVGAGKDTNIALGALDLASQHLPLGAETTVQTEVSSTHLGGVVNVHLELDGQALPSRPIELPVGGSRSIRMLVRGSRAGTLHGKIVLERKDPLAMDNVRYFTLQVSDRPVMLLARERGSADTTGLLVASAAALGQHRWVDRETFAIEDLDAGTLSDAEIVLLANVTFVSDAQWAALTRFVRRGGKLWLVAGPNMSAQAYNTAAARNLMPVELGVAEELDRPVAWKPTDYEHPLLQPFRRNPDFPLKQVEASFRFKVKSRSEESTIVVPYADGTPAVVERKVGEGRVLLWNFSPLPGRSNIRRLYQHPLLAQGVVRAYTRGALLETMLTVGQVANIAVPRSLGPATAAVKRPGRSGFEPVVVSPKRFIAVPADVPGHWDVQLTGEKKTDTVGFSTNAPSRESDLTPVDPNDARTYLPAELLEIVSSSAELRHEQRMVSEDLHIAGPLLLALLTLMIAESWFANRFYKRGSETAVE
ncbi:MAG: BatA domain-containing protein [Phycisphaerae bacterium]